MQIVVYSAQFFILVKVFVLTHAFWAIYEIHHYAQFASCKGTILSVRKKLASKKIIELN